MLGIMLGGAYSAAAAFVSLSVVPELHKVNLRKVK